MFWRQKTKNDSVLAEVATALRDVRDAIEAPPAPVEEPDSTSIQLVERLDSIENRFEELRGVCLRHLQSASQRLKLAEKKESDAEFDDDTPMQLPIPAPVSDNATNDVTDLQWAAQKIRERGESAII